MSPSSPQRNGDARARAREIAAKQSKRSTNHSRRWIQISVVVVLVVIIAIVAVVYTQSKKTDVPDAGPVPASANQYGGIVLTRDGIKKDASDVATRDSSKIDTSTVSAEPAEGSSGSASTLPMGLPSPEDAQKNGQPVRVTMFQDYNCIHCAQFEQQYGDDIEDKVKKGEIELEIRNLNFLDQETTTEYSSRAAAAAYSVAEQVDTEKFLEWQKEMFSHQGQGGLKNEEIEEIASKYGANIKDDLDSNKYRPMVNTTVAESQKNGISGTPTVYADSNQLGQEDFMSFLDKIEQDKKKS